jgi:membrane protease YdiL (CAAX protease family)
MLLYPVLSVYPQSIIYRAFLIHRYQPLFCSPQAIVLASATAFSFMHIIFHNPLAIWLTFVGGLLFACRYQKTGSLFVSSLEHALYGCLLFTIGLGRYFYTRAI